MERLTKTPRGASVAGVVTATLTAIAIVILGAPPWILIPTLWIGATAYMELGSWVDRRLDRR